MKKILCALCALFLIVLCLTGCSGNGGAAQQEEPKEEISIQEQDGIVSMTLPASYLGEDFDGTLTPEQRESGYLDVTMNSDGTATFTMGKQDYEEMLRTMELQIRQSLGEYPRNYGSIKEVQLSEDMTRASMIVDRDAYEDSFDVFAGLGLYMQAALYHTLRGVPEQEITLAIDMIDAVTGEVFESYLYPEE